MDLLDADGLCQLVLDPVLGDVGDPLHDVPREAMNDVEETNVALGSAVHLDVCVVVIAGVDHLCRDDWMSVATTANDRGIARGTCQVGARQSKHPEIYVSKLLNCSLYPAVYNVF